MPPSTTKTKIAMVMYTVSISFPSGNKVAMPYLPIVNAIPPKAPMGAKSITMCNPLKMYFEANFKGVITNHTAINFTKDGDYNAEVVGKMTLHGVTKDVKFTGKISIKSGKVTITSTQILLLQDYKISIPNAVKDKISKDVKVTVNTTLELMK